jgi:O-succinylbenzoic acid--CoA ligase
MLSNNAFLLKTQDSNLPAIYSKSVSLNYKQLKEKILETAEILRSSKIEEDDKVALIGKNDLDYICIVLALWQLKAVPVLINPRLVGEEIDFQTDLTDCKFVLISKDIELADLESDGEKIFYPFKSKNVNNPVETDKEINPDNTAVIIFTSGTEGKSKGVELSFNSLFQSAKIGDQVIHHTKEDKWLASLPFNHVGGFSIITRSLLFGSSLIIPDNLQTEALAKAIESFKPTLCSLVPTQLKRLISSDVQANEELRNVLLGGGYVDQKLVMEAIHQDWKIAKVYGSTETGSFVTALTEDECLENPTSVGKALSPNRIVILNENKFHALEGEVGEIAIYSPAVMKGYYNDDEKIEDYFEDEFYLTGDMGYLDTEGYLYLEARKKDMIITGGENVNPNEVEDRIMEHPDISDAAVFPLKDDEWGEIVAAAIVMSDSKTNISLEEIEKFLKDNIAGFKMPRKLFYEKELPKNELGKITRRILSEKYEGS